MVVVCGVKMGKTNNYNYSRVPGAAGGSNKKRFQQSKSTHSGAGEKRPSTLMLCGKYNKSRFWVCILERLQQRLCVHFYSFSVIDKTHDFCFIFC